MEEKKAEFVRFCWRVLEKEGTPLAGRGEGGRCMGPCFAMGTLCHEVIA